MSNESSQTEVADDNVQLPKRGRLKRVFGFAAKVVPSVAAGATAGYFIKGGALAAFGTCGLPVTASLVLGGAVAGATVGAGTSLTKTFAQAVSEKRKGEKTFKQAFKDSFSWKKMRNKALIGAAFGGGGGILGSAVSEIATKGLESFSLGDWWKSLWNVDSCSTGGTTCVAEAAAAEPVVVAEATTVAPAATMTTDVAAAMPLGSPEVAEDCIENLSETVVEPGAGTVEPGADVVGPEALEASTAQPYVEVAKQGDTLTDIIEAHYGIDECDREALEEMYPGLTFQEIITAVGEASGLENVHQIDIGDKITLPELSEIASEYGEAAGGDAKQAFDLTAQAKEAGMGHLIDSWNCTDCGEPGNDNNPVRKLPIPTPVLVPTPVLAAA